MDDDYDGVEEDGVFSRRIRPLDFVIILLAFVRDIFSAIDRVFDTLVELTAGHANYKTDQQVFLDETRVEIDSLPMTEE